MPRKPIKADERKHVTEIRDAADALLGASNIAEAYFARERFIEALRALDEWVKTATLQPLPRRALDEWVKTATLQPLPKRTTADA